jgi:serine/threonine-protein kinase
MDQEQWKKISRIFDLALTMSSERRTTYIRHLCADDPRLQREIDELFQSFEESDQLLEEHLEKNEALLDEFAIHLEKTEAEAKVDLTGRAIDQWKLTELLARGGMGSVYRAERIGSEIHQTGALKIMHQNLNTPENAQRFKLEQQILAGLNHPNIASRIDGGISEDGLPYLVMEYVEGKPILEYCDQRKLTIDDRLQLFIDVCEAVQYAHKNLIVHRDLKPENILVTDEGHVKILDFGIAKLLDPDLYEFSAIETRYGLGPMSLESAAPEQVSGEVVTTSTDQYALGIILYKLLAGIHSFDFDDQKYRSIVQTIQKEDPSSPSRRLSELDEPKQFSEIAELRSVQPTQLIKTLKGDLDAITLKALRKEPDSRYNSVDQLKEDIASYLQDQPVLAREKAVKYRVKKFIRRHRLGLTAFSLVVLSIIIGAGLAIWQAREARLATEVAQIEAERANEALAETEQALDRAEALHEFLLGLFRAAEPNRPKDQLPSTEELLALGARRALDEQVASPVERIGMLLTIGEIYLRQNRIEQAQPLLDTAENLARKHREERPEDLARALQQQASLARQGGDYGRSEALLLEAETVIGNSKVSWNTFANLRLDRGVVKLFEGKDEQALNLLEPLYVQTLERGDVKARLRARLMDRLASAYDGVGNLDSAASIRADATELLKQLEGPESLNYAISLVESASLEHNMGRFNVAEPRIRKAIALFDRIFGEQPASSRANAHRIYGMILLHMGNFEKALDEIEASSVEWAHVMRIKDVTNWEFLLINRGYFLMRMHRWSEAERDLAQANSLSAALSTLAMNSVESGLAITLCRQGRTNEGKAILAELDSRLNGQLPNQPSQRALIHEARATCHFQAKKLELALREVDLALEAQIDFPGLVLNQFDRRILLARILAALDQNQKAKYELERAESLFLDYDLSDHPHFSNIEMARQNLVTIKK